MSKNLEHLARRVEGDPFFLAAALAACARSEQLDDGALAARLGCEVTVLTNLRLCRMPRTDAPLFWQDVERVAGRFGVNADALAEVVRHGQSLLRLRETAGARDQDAGFLLAARDRPQGERPDPPEGGPR